MNVKHEILILQRSKTLPEKLRETLRLEGFLAQTVFSVGATLQALDSVRAPILLVDCGDSRAVRDKVAQSLVDSAQICKLPVVFMSSEATLLEPTFTKYFVHARLLDYPVTLEVIVQVLQEIVSGYPKYLELLQKVAPQEYYQKQLAEAASEPPAPRSLHPDYAKGESVAHVLFRHSKDLGLNEARLGGELYPNSITSEVLRSMKCFPSDPAAQAEAQNILQALRARERGHLSRAAFINGRSTDVLQLPNDVADSGKAASVLLATGFLDNRESLLRVNYLNFQGSLLRKEISGRVLSGVEKLDGKLVPQVAEILTLVGKLIADEAAVGDDNISLLASTIVGADLVDRVCYGSGYWDPHATRTLLVKLRSGLLGEIHPRALACLIKFLAESISEHKPAHLVPQKKRRDSELLRVARETKAQDVGPEEKKVPLASLTPGMKLSQELRAFDGRVILDSDLTLDEDHIWRLWQLAAVRPLNCPLVVRTGSVQKLARS